jgi:hypothetical protein
MPAISVASANLEWMNDRFTSDSDPVAFKSTFTRGGYVNNTPKTAQKVADLIRAIDHKEYKPLIVNDSTHRADRPSDHVPLSVQLTY